MFIFLVIYFFIYLFIHFSETLTNLRLGRRIISSTVNPAPSGILEENVTISFRYEKVHECLQ